ncbi:MAG: hypothetical protein R3C70_03585 [Geminicoccaceae bacterium]
MSVSESIARVGTDVAGAEVETFRIGPLAFTLDRGAVRHVRYHGAEAIRGIDYLVRDENWATPPARLTGHSVERDDDRVRIAFSASVAAPSIRYEWDTVIEATGEGLVFTVVGRALEAFRTNRTGFTILHPIEGVAGAPVTVEHTDGAIEETRFPRLISPGQPIFAIRALTHSPAPGLSCTCRMEAELPHDPAGKYEMEDQRNWTDASYKTYVASLLDPWSYTLEPGRSFTQRITLSFEGETAGSGSTGSTAPVRRRLPQFGLGVMPRQAGHALSRAGDIPRVDWLAVYLGLDDGDARERLVDYRKLAEATGASIQLELELPLASPPADELARAAAFCKAARLEPAIVLPCPTAYLKSVQPVGPWPNVPDLGHIYNQARRAFPKARIAGGMLSYFTELNRKRPPAVTVDIVSHTTTAIVHAGDDLSVMETLEALPQVAASVHGFAGGKTVRVGPSAIGMRHNPYGAALIDNPGNDRFAMAAADPRQRGLFAAAWSVGYVAALLESDIEALILNHVSGPLGVIHDPALRPAPWFEGRAGDLVYPVYHVMRWFAGRSGIDAAVHRHEGSCIGIRTDRGSIIANIGQVPVGLPVEAKGRMSILDVASFEAACADPAWLDHACTTGDRLDALSVAFFHD